MDKKVVLTNPNLQIDPKLGGELLQLAEVVTAPDTTPEAILSVARDADSLLVGAEDIRRPLIEQLDKCTHIHRMGIGVDFVDVDAATEHGITVTNVPDANHREVAMHALAMIFALTRRLKFWDAGVRAGRPSDFQVGSSIRRSTAQRVGILGLGRIGRHMAAVFSAAGFEVVGYDPFVDAAAASELGVHWLPLDEVIATANILTLHLPLTDDTRNLIGATELAAMPQGSFIVNVSRGGLIDEDALADALASGQTAGAGVDTTLQEPLPPNSRLTEAENVFLSPHAAHFSAESGGEIYVKSIAELTRVVKGEPPLSPVNQPATVNA